LEVEEVVDGFPYLDKVEWDERVNWLWLVGKGKFAGIRLSVV